MKKLFLPLFVVLAFVNLSEVYSQQALHAKTQPATARKANYLQFTQPVTVKSDEVLKANKGFEQDPELGIVYKNTPASYYELLGSRTEKTKTFAKTGSNGKEIVIRSSNL